MGVERAPIWQHRPATGPVAWGAAVTAALVAPIPLVWLGTLLEVREVPYAVLVTSLTWGLVGVGVATAPHRIGRGVGIGLVAGVVVCVLVLLVWRTG